jgi:hypothetical protein
MIFKTTFTPGNFHLNASLKSYSLTKISKNREKRGKFFLIFDFQAYKIDNLAIFKIFCAHGNFNLNASLKSYSLTKILKNRKNLAEFFF